MRFFFIVKFGFIEMILGVLRGLNLGGLIVQSSFSLPQLCMISYYIRMVMGNTITLKIHLRI
jgi:hypothetical protein